MLEKIKKVDYRKVVSIAGAVAILGSCFVFAFANAGSGVKNVIETFLGYVLDIFISIGALLLFWAVGQLALAFKDDNPESKSRAMMMLVAAAILISVGALAGPILNQVASGLKPGGGFLGLRNT